MLTILFKILGILGILLLVLLGIALTVILLVLFFPLCYKASGQKSADEMRFSVKVRWLFGLVRIFYNYPQPGKLLAKILFFTVYDSSDERKEKKHVSTGKSSKKAVVPPTTEIPQEAVPPASDPQPSVKEPIPEQKSTKERGFFNKIRYTVGKICDKIKHILNNITFYKDLWNDPETRGLLRQIPVQPYRSYSEIITSAKTGTYGPHRHRITGYHRLPVRNLRYDTSSIGKRHLYHSGF